MYFDVFPLSVYRKVRSSMTGLKLSYFAHFLFSVSVIAALNLVCKCYRIYVCLFTTWIHLCSDLLDSACSVQSPLVCKQNKLCVCLCTMQIRFCSVWLSSACSIWVSEEKLPFTSFIETGTWRENGRHLVEFVGTSITRIFQKVER